MDNRKEWYRSIPKMDRLLQEEWAVQRIQLYGRGPVTEAIRESLSDIRSRINGYEDRESFLADILHMEALVQKRLEEMFQPDFCRVHNATGVILHTNLGRAPLSEKLLKEVTPRLLGYSNLEYDLQKGCRGERYSHFASLICRVTGAEDCLVVNNNAAAVLLMLSAVGAGRQVIVSRGEQVEIGGKFRIPDIMDQSGCKRVEVGTTNKTRCSDYEEAITEETAALLKVHTSNFAILGFTESVSREDLVSLGHKYDLPVLEDLGSGVLTDLSEYGLKKEPTVQDSVAAGVDLVSFSGDKLLGGVQAGIIVGRKKYIDLLKKHPLTRALRIDKFTVAYLESVFKCYLDPQKARKEIPVLRMLSLSAAELEARARRLREILSEKTEREIKSHNKTYKIFVVPCESAPGGGSLPGEVMAGYGVYISGCGLHPDRVARKMRNADHPVLVRIERDGLLFDVRTLEENELSKVAETTAVSLKAVLEEERTCAQ